MHKWLQRLDPRLHLTSAIGWVVMGVVTLAAGVAAWLAAAQVEVRARADAEGLLAEYATQVRDAVSMNLEMRSQLLQVVAVQISATAGQSPLEQLQALQAIRKICSDPHGFAEPETRRLPIERLVNESPKMGWMIDRLKELEVGLCEGRCCDKHGRDDAGDVHAGSRVKG